MNLKEAYAILELSESATPDEAKKKYRDLTKKFHPDINKEAGAEDKFKKINEAYQVVSSGKGSDREDDWGNTPNPFDVMNSVLDPFNMGRHAVHHVGHIELQATISFKDSILGCSHDIKYHRNTKCVDCQGNGKLQANNGCLTCNGKGKVIGRQGNMVFVSTCSKCRGQIKSDPCNKCNSKGVLDTETSLSVTIPGGIQDSNILRINQMGHFITTHNGVVDQHSDAHLRVHVSPEPGLRLEGMNVASNINISLLEALQGCKKTVNTILGNKEVDIKPKSKNKDEVIIPKLGVNQIGCQRVILDIQYPDEVGGLIEFLSK